MPAARNFTVWQQFPAVAGRLTVYHTAAPSNATGQQIQNLSAATGLGAWRGIPTNPGNVPRSGGYLASVRDCCYIVFPTAVAGAGGGNATVEVPAPNGRGSITTDQILDNDQETLSLPAANSFRGAASGQLESWSRDVVLLEQPIGHVLWGYTYWFGHQVADVNYVQTSVWVDTYGDHVMTHIPTQFDQSNVFDQVVASSNAGCIETMRVPFIVNPYLLPLVESHYSLFEQADLVFQCADGTETTLVVPMPADLLFMSDGITVDKTAAGALIATYLLEGTNRRGSPVNRYMRGRKHALRRTERTG